MSKNRQDRRSHNEASTQTNSPEMVNGQTDVKKENTSEADTDSEKPADNNPDDCKEVEVQKEKLSEEKKDSLWVRFTSWLAAKQIANLKETAQKDKESQIQETKKSKDDEFLSQIKEQFNADDFHFEENMNAQDALKVIAEKITCLRDDLSNKDKELSETKENAAKELSDANSIKSESDKKTADAQKTERDAAQKLKDAQQIEEKANSAKKEAERKREEAEQLKREARLSEERANSKEREAKLLKEDADKKLRESEQKLAEADNEKQNAQKLLQDAEEIKKSAEILRQELEASDKGQLNVQLKEKNSQLEELVKQLGEKSVHVNKLTEEKKVADAQIQSLKDAEIVLKQEIDNNKKEFSEKLASEKKEYSSKLDALKIQHKDELNKKDSENAQAKQQMIESHKAEIDKIKVANDAEKQKMQQGFEAKLTEKDNAISQLKQTHKSEVDQLQRKHVEESTALNAKIDTLNKEVASLNGEMQSESDLVRTKSIDLLKEMQIFLQSNDVLLPCGDEYREQAEEKNNDLQCDVNLLVEKIETLSKVNKPSLWKEALCLFISEQISKNTFIINRLLKYYAMSNVPFMIDSNRDNGLYFERKNIKHVYDLIVMLLSHCGITPIIPSIFVENVKEGAYEVEGQFNDIESFCPGSINSHVEQIERSQEGLESVIVGVTRVGYVLSDGSVVKAQVLIK